MSEEERKDRLEVLELTESNPDVFIDVAVEIKTATTPNTIGKSKADLQNVTDMPGRSVSHSLFVCKYGDGVFLRLVTSEHRVQSRHHVSLLDLTHAIYVMSTNTRIIYV